VHVRSTLRVLRPAALGFLLVLVSTGAATSGEPGPVNVTDVTLDRVAYLCGDAAVSACAVVTGTITCDAAGPARTVHLVLSQRGVSGTDNDDLLDFACSTQPTPFGVVVESLVCDAGFVNNPTGCFKPGLASVRATLEGAPIAAQRTLLRKG